VGVKAMLGCFMHHVLFFNVSTIRVAVFACVLGVAHLYPMSTMLMAAQSWHLPVPFAPLCSSKLLICRAKKGSLCAQQANMPTLGMPWVDS
jgi:hypothetical protein